MLRSILKSMRPRQWSKNLILFTPLLFSFRQYWQPFRPEMWRLLALTLAAFAVFCLLSGAVYLFNDLVDVEKDRAHPRKRLRPIASGKLGSGAAKIALVVILLIAFAAALSLDRLAAGYPYPAAAPILPFPYPFTLVGAAYIVLQIAYSFYLKHRVILDVFSVAAGFILRAVGGAAVIQVPISPWLYVVTILLSLFISFSKRRNELTVLEDAAPNHRAILREYTPELLDEMIAVTTASTVISYSLYTFSAENLPKNHAMMLTIPFVLYGIFRYLYLIHVKNEGGSPEELLLRDRSLATAVVLWCLAVVAILYFFGRAA